MSDEHTNFPIFEVWKEYEKIAMHFNDLLVKIRTQALGVIATLSTLMSIMSGTDEGGVNWPLLAIGFFVLAIIWLAIWVLDFSYYNRLLHGAVYCILEVEEISMKGKVLNAIELSTRVEQAVSKKPSKEEGSQSKYNLGKGRWIFYILVMAVLLAVSILSLVMWCGQS